MKLLILLGLVAAGGYGAYRLAKGIGSSIRPTPVAGYTSCRCGLNPELCSRHGRENLSDWTW